MRARFFRILPKKDYIALPFMDKKHKATPATGIQMRTPLFKTQQLAENFKHQQLPSQQVLMLQTDELAGA